MIVTTIEQSKRLIELRLDPDTADMCYINGEGEAKWNEKPQDWDDVPAWSLEALLNLLPSEFVFGKYIEIISIRKQKLTEEKDVFQIAYGSDQGSSHEWHDMINTAQHDNLLDAAYDIMIWLLENNKIWKIIRKS